MTELRAAFCVTVCSCGLWTLSKASPSRIQVSAKVTAVFRNEIRSNTGPGRGIVNRNSSGTEVGGSGKNLGNLIVENDGDGRCAQDGTGSCPFGNGQGGVSAGVGAQNNVVGGASASLRQDQIEQGTVRHRTRFSATRCPPTTG